MFMLIKSTVLVYIRAKLYPRMKNYQNERIYKMPQIFRIFFIYTYMYMNRSHFFKWSFFIFMLSKFFFFIFNFRRNSRNAIVIKSRNKSEVCLSNGAMRSNLIPLRWYFEVETVEKPFHCLSTRKWRESSGWICMNM